MINKLLKREDLSYDESYGMFADLKKYRPETISAMLALLQSKKETVEEILGALAYFEEHSTSISHEFDVMDIVGTGGDGSGVFNVSTAASFVVASCGVYVAKNGGASATSKAGSLDVISELKVKTPQNEKQVLKMLQNTYYSYLCAPLFNQALNEVAQLRGSLGFASIFNILGPLLNPMRPKKCLIGVYRRDLVGKFADILKRQGVTRALVLHSDDGLDEISISSTTYVQEVFGTSIKEYTIDPQDYFSYQADILEIKGGYAHENASIIEDVLSGVVEGPKMDVVLLNAGAALYVSGLAKSIKHGVSLAKTAILEGKALALLNKIRCEG